MKSLVHRLLIESVHDFGRMKGTYMPCYDNNNCTQNVYSLILFVFYTTKSICLGPQLQED